MKKILLFLLLFVNLQIVTSECDFFVKVGTEAVAQRFQVQDGDFWWCNEGDDLGWYRSVVPCWEFEVKAEYLLSAGNDSHGGGGHESGSHTGTETSHENGGGGSPVFGDYHPNNNQTVDSASVPNKPKSYHKPEQNEVLFKEKLPAEVARQLYNYDCVLTAIAICQSLMEGKYSIDDMDNLNLNIEYACAKMLDLEFFTDLQTGLNSSQTEALMEKLGYSFENINTIDNTSMFGILESIANGFPVLAGITPEAMSSIYGVKTNKGHEVVIVGYFNDGVIDAFQCLDPATGTYVTRYTNEFYPDGFYSFMSNFKKRK